MGGVWVGAGMYLGGIVGGFLQPLIGPVIGNLPFGGIIGGLANAYVVQMIASRFTRNAGLMAAGAFAGTAMGAISGVLGGAGGLVSGITGGHKQPPVTRPSQTINSGSQGNVIQMPAQG